MRTRNELFEHARIDGREARLRGKPRDANPWKPDRNATSYKGWAAGWDQMDQQVSGAINRPYSADGEEEAERHRRRL